MSTCPAITIPGIAQPVPGYWAGTAVPYPMHYLKPRHVRALGHVPRRGKSYAIRDGNELCTVSRAGYTATLATVPSLPRLHISQPTT